MCRMGYYAGPARLAPSASGPVAASVTALPALASHVDLIYKATSSTRRPGTPGSARDGTASEISQKRSRPSSRRTRGRP